MKTTLIKSCATLRLCCFLVIYFFRFCSMDQKRTRDYYYYLCQQPLEITNKGKLYKTQCNESQNN